MNPVENYFDAIEEPEKGFLLALRKLILSLDDEITLGFAFGTPFFYYKKKMFCYFWLDKKTGKPYLAVAKGKFIDHPLLRSDGRKLFKILPLDPEKDIDIDTVTEILQEAMTLYR